MLTIRLDMVNAQSKISIISTWYKNDFWSCIKWNTAVSNLEIEVIIINIFYVNFMYFMLLK